MKDFYYTTNKNEACSSTGFDEGAKKYFLNIYYLMFGALCITAISAFAALSEPTLITTMFQIAPNGQVLGITGIGWLVTFAPLTISLFFTFSLHKIESQTALMLFWVYAVLMGMSLSALGIIYTGTLLKI